MNLENLPDESDTSDDDYIPDSKQEDAVSELDSDGNLEEPLSGDEENSSKLVKKRRKKATKSRKKQKRSEPAGEGGKTEKATDVTEEDKKKNEEDLWADFMKDTGFQSKNSSTQNQSNKGKTKPSSISNCKATETIVPQKRVEKVKITQIFEFAGEEVEVEKEVAADSAEAKLLSKPTSEYTKNSTVKSKAGLSGISNVLSQLGKKPKISTLEKSKLDWDKFKKEEDIEEELQTYNKGKDGYLERQDFLQRADLRQFEIEKEIRAVERSKRLNNA